MSMILALETSGNEFSVALIQDKRIIAFEAFEGERRQEQLLMPAVEKLLSRCNIQPSSLTAIAAGSGPGSYTGLRIGMAFASGFAFANRIPLIPVGTLENMAFQIQESCPDASALLVVMEARKEEFFLASWSRDFKTTFIEPACHPIQEIPGLLKEIPVNQLLACNISASPVIVSLSSDTPVTFYDVKADARNVALMASEKWQEGGISTLGSDEPDYLKPVYISVKK